MRIFSGKKFEVYVEKVPYQMDGRDNWSILNTGVGGSPPAA